MEWIRDILLDLGVEPTNVLIQGTMKIINAIVIFIIMKIIIRIGNRFVTRFFNKKKIGRMSIEERRANTLSTILKSVFRYTVYFIGIMTIAGFFVEVTSLIAVAGVGSLAVGFGAQSLVKDVVTGFFIFFEDQFSVGDYVTVSGFGGIVEVMGLRTTLVRDFNGDLHIIPNGEITKVTNHSRGNMRALVDVGIAYEEDVQSAIDVLQELCIEIAQESQAIMDGPYVLGVHEMKDSSVNIRITAQTANMEQWAVERLLRQRIKETFDKVGIEIPYPKRVLYQEKSEG